MVNFVLNDLGRPTFIGFQPGLELRILVTDFDFPVARRFSWPTQQRQTAFFRFVLAGCRQNLRIKHRLNLSVFKKYDDTLAYTDHIGGHAHAAFPVGKQRIL